MMGKGFPDLGAGGRIGVPAPVTNPETKDQYYVSSLIEEAITSSELEGATTTREVAKEMIRAARPPRDRSERMILNNFLTMQQISQLKDQALTKEFLCELHRLVTEGTLPDPSAAGRLRRGDENIFIGDDSGHVVHVPPPAETLADRLTAMCDFANSKTPPYFIHPVLRSIMLHFWLAYDHPFVDGNGRTARALFYWSMLHYGFWLCEYISILRIILKAPAQYGRAFLYTETDDNDLTYFILHQIDVIRRAVEELHKYIEMKAARLKVMERELRSMVLFNHRQRALISHALCPGAMYHILRIVPRSLIWIATARCLARPWKNLIRHASSLIWTRRSTTCSVIAETYRHTVCKMRTHVKNLKTPLLAHMQIRAGGTVGGVCAAKVAEAEVMVEGGIHDILIANQVVSRDKIAPSVRPGATGGHESGR